MSAVRSPSRRAQDLLGPRELPLSTFDGLDTLASAHEELEHDVGERTSELVQTIEKLRSEIAERERAETALRDSEKRLRLVIQNMPVLVDAFDDEGHIVVWNRECEETSG